MKTEQNIRFLQRNPPQLPADQIQEHLIDQYGMSGKLTPLDAEKDQNLRLSTSADGDFVIKVCNQLEPVESVEFQLGALTRIAQCASAVPVPRVICGLSGQEISYLEDAEGSRHCVYVLSYLAGELLVNVHPGVETYRALGRTLAQIDIALRVYIHPAADQDHPWSLHRCLRFRQLTHLIENESTRDQVEQTFARLGERWPDLQKLRHQVIHHDAHSRNVLIDKNDATKISGVIDFNDMTWGTYATELALACNGVPFDRPDALQVMAELVHGFDCELPLEEAEVDAIYDMMCARLALSVTIAAARHRWYPEEDHFVARLQEPAQQLDVLLGIGRNAISHVFRKACRFPTRNPAPTADALIAARHRLMGENCRHFYDKPLHFEQAKGAELFGSDGHAYLDTYNNVPQVGHCDSHVVKAIARQAAALNTNTRYLYDSAIEYAERLTDKLPPHLDTCLFANSGSEANDIAWQMAKAVSGHSGGLLMEDGYHGITESMRAFSPGHPDVKLPEHLRGLQVPDPYRGVFRDGEADIAERYAADADRALGELQASHIGVAAFMVDSAFCSSGIPDVPDGYLRGVERRVRAAGGLMICDEVQSGFGRMGQWWGHEHHGVTADIVTLGKPVGNGHPLGVVVTRKDILEQFNAVRPLFSTFGGNTVACAAGNAVLDVIERDNLIEHGAQVGAYFRERLHELAGSQQLIGDIRGYGALIGVEFVTDRKTRAPAMSEVAELIEAMRRRHVLVGKAGQHGNIFKLRPSLVFQKHQVDQFIEALDASLSEL